MGTARAGCTLLFPDAVALVTLRTEPTCSSRDSQFAQMTNSNVPNLTQKRLINHTQRNLLAGVITVIPIWITWLVFDFILEKLRQVGTPLVQAVSRGVQSVAPALAEWMLTPWFQSLLAVILTLMALYLLGLTATFVIGKRMLQFFDALMQRIPFVQTIYGAAKKLVNALQQKPGGGGQRVVLIEFPTPGMKAVGFMTRVMTDKNTGQQLAAVYVPTAPNPTSGYVEIVPLESVVATDWTIDEAMNFVVSGGAVAPDFLVYAKPTTDTAQDPTSPTT